VRGLCRALFELLVPSVCPACDAPRAPIDTLLCGACAARVRRLPRLRGVHTAIAYEGAGLELVRRFKFEHRHDARELLVHWLAERARALRFDAIVPLPRHPARVRSEGADPVHELARGLARATGVALFGGALRGRRVLLLDDVATTGATLAEAARTLRRAGATRIALAAVAGTPAMETRATAVL